MESSNDRTAHLLVSFRTATSIEGIVEWSAVLIALVLISACASGLVPPILLSSGELDYPEEAKRSSLEGSVTISYDLDEHGVLSNAVVIKSDPEGVFDEAALDFIISWRFQPQKRQGTPEAVYGLTSKIQFVLKRNDSSYLPFLKDD